GTTDVLDGHGIHFAGPQILMEPLVNAVEFVAVPGAVGEVDPGRTMAINAPSHAEGGELFHLVHLRDRSVAGLALYLSGLGMLCVAEEYVIGKVMDLDPFYRFGVFHVILAGLGVIPGIAV